MLNEVYVFVPGLDFEISCCMVLDIGGGKGYYF